MSSEDYFEQISDVMEIEAPSAIVVTPLRNSTVQFARMTSGRRDHGVLQTPLDDAYLLTLELLPLPEVNIWLNGQHHLKDATPAGNFSLVNLNVDTVVEMDLAFDSVEMVFPRSAMKALADEFGGRAPDFLSAEGLEQSTNDAVVRHLACSLLPAFRNPAGAGQLFVDHVALATLTYLAETYGGMTRPRIAAGGLAPWQVRRATDLLADRLAGELSLEDLASECGLSRSHFARAFKKSTGKPPHRWLVEKRLQRAKDLMLESQFSLAEIADTCGFSDQSHFTRSFSAAFGTPPAEWRRIRRY